MKKLVLSLSSKNGGKIPSEFREVSISRLLKWDYWTIVRQPYWFLDRLMLYIKAEGVAEKILSKKGQSSGSKLRLPRKSRGARRR